MCGFVAIVTPTGRPVSSAVLHEMTERLAHRGPDDFGYACIDPRTGESEDWRTHCPRPALSGVLLGHRRLSILDLGPGGHQPMFNEDRSMVLAFNGEIYNFVELRAELRSHGVAFRSRSDTEVVLKAYEHWGPAAFEKFNGMWALALWDGRERKLIVSRDRFGVKPLYHTRLDGTWVFGSEIKALLAFPGAFRGFRSDGVQAFIERTNIDCDERTFFEEIHSVPPGSYLVIDGESMTQQRFWSLHIDDRHRGQPRQALVARFADLLDDSVRLRVRSDVPIGTMLSGGLDSTSITALIHEQRVRDGHGSATQESVGLRSFHHTFTACWPGWSHNEEAQVDNLCDQLGLVSHKSYLSAESMAGVLQEVAYHLEEPFESPTALVQYLLMKKAKEVGVTVVLNGHGSDEALAGYPNQFVPLFLADQFPGHPLRFVKETLRFRETTGWTFRQSLDHAAKAHRKVRASAGYLSPPGSPDNQKSVHWARRHHAVIAPGGLSALNTELWKTFSTYMLPRWLRMEDRMSMAASVESRLPFMDYRLVEFAFNLPDEFKLRNGYTKAILRDAMRTRLPDAIVLDRVKKRFGAPWGSWLRGPWRGAVEDALLGSCQLEDHVDMSEVRSGLRAFLNGSSSTTDPPRIWRTFNAELCLRAFAGGLAQNARTT